MNIVKKVLLIFLSFGIFSFLLFTTYISKDTSVFNKPFYQDLSIIDSYGSGNTKITRLDNFNEILAIKGELNEKGGNINLQPGIYLFNFNSLTNNYSIKLDGYEIESNNSSKFFINNLNEKQIIIFSLNGIVDVNIKKDSGEYINKIHLYPHKYVLLNKKINNRVETNSDLKKMQQLFSLNYFNKSILDKDDNLDLKFKKIITGNRDIEIIDTTNYLKDNYTKNKQIIDGFKNSDFGTIIGEELIKQYSKLFLNGTKKNIYYKNLIIRALGDLINSDKKDLSKINFIVDSLNELEEIDSQGHSNISKYIYYYSYLIFSSNQENINSKININLLINKLNNSKTNFKEDSLLKLNNIFFKYDFVDKKINSEYFNQISLNPTQKQKEYYVFFLSNILKVILENSNYGINNVNGILDLYLKNSNEYYFNSLNIDSTITKTGILNYHNILENIMQLINNHYFEENRDENGLLVLKNTNIDNNQIIRLEKNINLINEYYGNYLYVLDDKKSTNKITKDDFKKFQKEYKEFFLSLKDNEAYIALYDKQKDELLSSDTVGEGYDDSLEKNKAKEYLKQFYGIDINNLEVIIRNYNYCQTPIESNIDNLDEYCYEILNLKVGNNKIDFLLTPSEANRISKFKVNGDSSIKKGSYKLDYQKTILDDKYESAVEEDKNKYDFSRFFVNNFNLNKNEYATDIKISDGDSENNINNSEDIVVKVFKRNQLLGEKGDFTLIKNFLKIEYENIFVERIGEQYDIRITDAEITKKISTQLNIKGTFESNYIFNPDHSFVNPRIRFVNEDDFNINKGNFVNIEGTYKLTNIENELTQLFLNINNLDNLINILSEFYLTNKMDITYFKTNNDIKVKINDTTLTLNNDKITSIKVKTREKLINSIGIKDVNNILNSINN